MSENSEREEAVEAEPAIFRFMRRIGTPQGESCDENDPEKREGGIFCSIMILNSVIERAGNRILESHGLTLPQWLALGAVTHSGENGLSHSELSARLMLSKAPVTGLVDRMERAGWVERRPDSNDRRVSRVVACEGGARLWETAHSALHDSTEVDLNACLSEQEQDQLLHLLGRLLESFAAHDELVADLCVSPCPTSEGENL